MTRVAQRLFKGRKFRLMILGARGGSEVMAVLREQTCTAEAPPDSVDQETERMNGLGSEQA